MRQHIAATPGERAITRRRLVRLAGLAGFGAAAATVGNPRPTGVLADATPEAFLADAYRRRIQAMNTGDATVLAGLYDSANPVLTSFEKERARFFHGGLGQRWDGVPLQFDSSVSLISIDATASEVRARIYEWIRVEWVQNVHPIDPIMASNIRKDPTRFLSRLPKGPLERELHDV